MRQGSNAQLVFDKHGQIFAISTGSDACAEHECGSKELQAELCGTPDVETTPYGRIRAAMIGAAVPKTDDDVVDALRAGQSFVYPSLIDRKRIARNLDQLVFAVAEENGQKVAVFGFGYQGENTIRTDHGQLISYNKADVVGAWDERSFAIKVYGDKLVKKLQTFANMVKDGDGVFAGTFLTKHGKAELTGVVIALQSALRPEHRKEISDAQAKWEANMRLSARSRAEELARISRDKKVHPHAASPGFIWPVWKDGVVDSEVRYALNPSYQVDAQYWGPYTFEQLHDWIVAAKKFPLKPIRDAA